MNDGAVPRTAELNASEDLDLPVPAVLTPLVREEAERVARLFKAVSDPARVQLLSMIESSAEGEACVLDLTEPLGLTQPTVSHHLKILVDAGLLTRDKRGTWAWYAIAPDRLEALRALIGEVRAPARQVSP